MPASDALPVELQKLSTWNAATVRPDPDFPADMKKLIEVIEVSQKP